MNDGASGPCPSRRLAQGGEIETIWHFPRRQKPGSFSVGDALQKLTSTRRSDDLALGRCGRPGCLTAGAERDGNGAHGRSKVGGPEKSKGAIPPRM